MVAGWRTVGRMNVLALLFAASLAHADAVGPDPTGCPPGSRGTSSHAGEWCEPTECDTRAECAEGERCETQGLCIEVQTRECGGNRPDTAEPCFFDMRIAHGTCRDDDDCDVGSCEIATRCVGGGLGSGACRGCSGPEGMPAAFAGVLLLVAAAGLRVRAR